MHENNSQTSCIICQFNNSSIYLPAFLAYHLRIVDHVFLIDHNSSKDYRRLSCNRVTVFRSTISTYRLDININALLNVINAKNKFDWIFVLDIDEFLPFQNKKQIHQFLCKYRYAQCISFKWRNGILKDGRSDSRIESDSIIDFQLSKSKVKKLGYNTGAIRNWSGKNLYVTHGNHSAIFFAYGSRLLGKLLVKKIQVEEPLFHIPFLAFDRLSDKLDLKQYEFKTKILRSTDRLSKKYGPEWYNSRIDLDDIYWLVANYRTQTGDFVDASRKDFEPIQLFRNIETELNHWGSLIGQCKEGVVLSESVAERKFLNEFGKDLKRYRKSNLKRYRESIVVNHDEFLIGIDYLV